MLNPNHSIVEMKTVASSRSSCYLRVIETFVSKISFGCASEDMSLIEAIKISLFCLRVYESRELVNGLCCEHEGITFSNPGDNLSLLGLIV